MISLDLKSFIERNISLLENDPSTFFYKALYRLRGTTFEELIHMLEDAQIDFETHRKSVLIKRLAFIFSDVHNNTPLTDVIKESLMSRRCLTFFGLTMDQIFEFIVDNESMWSDDIHLEMLHGVMVVRKNYDN